MTKVNNFINKTQTSIYKDARPYGRLAALPVAIVDVTAGTLRHPLNAVENLGEVISNVVKAPFSRNHSLTLAFYNTSDLLQNVARTPIAIGMAPFKLINQFVLFTLDPQSTKHSNHIDKRNKQFNNECHSTYTTIRTSINIGGKVLPRFLAIPAAIASVALSIFAQLEYALYNGKEALLNTCGLPLKYVFEEQAIQQCTVRYTLQKIEHCLEGIANAGVKVIMSPIYLVYCVASILYDPEHALQL